MTSISTSSTSTRMRSLSRSRRPKRVEKRQRTELPQAAADECKTCTAESSDSLSATTLALPFTLVPLSETAPNTSAQKLLAENRDLSSAIDSFKRHAAHYDLSLARSLQMFAIGLVFDLASLRFYGYQQYEAGINSGGDIAAHTQAISTTVENIEKLIDLLEARCLAAKAQEGRVGNTKTTDILYSAQYKQMCTALASARTIRSFKAQRQNAQAQRDEILASMHTQMRTNFVTHFDPTRFGSIVAVREGMCGICLTNYDASEEGHHRIAPLCCNEKQALCVECLRRHVFADSNNACKSFFSCPFCKHEHSLYPQLPLQTTSNEQR